MIQVVIDVDKGLCRLEVKNWANLEYLDEKERAAQIAHESVLAIKQNNSQAIHRFKASKFKSRGSLSSKQHQGKSN